MHIVRPYMSVYSLILTRRQLFIVSEGVQCNSEWNWENYRLEIFENHEIEPLNFMPLFHGFLISYIIEIFHTKAYNLTSSVLATRYCSKFVKWIGP